MTMFTMKSFQSTLRHLPFLLLLLLLLPAHSHSFSLEKMCETRCIYGRGGNLCNCNVFHFAGKRSEDSSPSSSRSFLALAAFDGWKYRNPHGGVAASASGVDDPFRSEERRNGGVSESKDGGEMVVEEFFADEEGREKMKNLAFLLKAVLDEQLIGSDSSSGSSRTTRNWQESAFPFNTDDDAEY